MSYCRFGNDSDVYVYKSESRNGKPIWVIHTGKDESYTARSLEDLKYKLNFFKNEGKRVPSSAFERIEKELKEYKTTKHLERLKKQAAKCVSSESLKR